MGVVEAKIQTVEDIYRLVWTAVASRCPLGAVYRDLPRLFCPHRLGRNRAGQLRVLCYQYGGKSESGLEPIGSPANRRCIVLETPRQGFVLDCHRCAGPCPRGRSGPIFLSCCWMVSISSSASSLRQRAQPTRSASMTWSRLAFRQHPTRPEAAGNEYAMPLSEFSAPSPGMPAKENVAAGRSQPSVTIEHESLPGVDTDLSNAKSSDNFLRVDFIDDFLQFLVIKGVLRPPHSCSTVKRSYVFR